MRPDYPSNCPYPFSIPKNGDWAQIDGPVQVSLRCSAAYRKPLLFIEHIMRCALKQRGKTAQCYHRTVQKSLSKLVAFERLTSSSRRLSSNCFVFPWPSGRVNVTMSPVTWCSNVFVSSYSRYWISDRRKLILLPKPARQMDWICKMHQFLMMIGQETVVRALLKYSGMYLLCYSW